MKKVVTVSLAGKSYQVEEAGYDALQRYMEKASKRLASNPDREDILLDIEQSIADKCTASLRPGQDVLSAVSVEEALRKVGPVENDEDTDVEPGVNATDRTRKLYTLPKEGKISGVCAGLAAYFSVDVTLMRLLFVLLIFITQGVMVLVYIGMIVAMPTAKTPEEIAEAHGRPGTAKEIVDKVKYVASESDTVTKVGSVIAVVGKSVALIFMALFSVGFIVATIVWIWVLWAIGLGSLKLYDQLAVLNGWKQVVFVTALYVLVAVPLLAFIRALNKVFHPENDHTTSMKTNVANSTIVTLIVIATVTVFAFGSTYAPRVRDYVGTHDGYLHVGEHRVCADETKCGAKTINDLAPPRIFDVNGKEFRG